MGPFAYAWDDRARLDIEPADAGMAELDDSTLTLSATARGAVCSDDDRLVLEDVEHVPVNLARLLTLGPNPRQRLEDRLTAALAGLG